MLFEWDDKKEAENFRKHGVRFIRAALIFRSKTLKSVDDRKDYGETRFISIGMVKDECFVVVHTQRGASIRIISAWKGGHDEKEQYRQLYA